MTKWELPETYIFNDRIVRFGVSGSGPPVVVVHGTPWSSFNMRHLIEAFSEDRTVYYYDLIGYGQSDMSPGDVSLGVQNEILDRLLNLWGLKKPPIIGHDFGGGQLFFDPILKTDANLKKLFLLIQSQFLHGDRHSSGMSKNTSQHLRAFQIIFTRQLSVLTLIQQPSSRLTKKR